MTPYSFWLSEFTNPFTPVMAQSPLGMAFAALIMLACFLDGWGAGEVQSNLNMIK